MKSGQTNESYKKMSRSRHKAAVRGKLLARRSKYFESLKAELEENMASANPYLSDIGEVAFASENQDLAWSIGTVESSALTEIDHALRRIEDGTYGKCEECGCRIPVARLRALPFAALCVRCKAREEWVDRARQESRRRLDVEPDAVEQTSDIDDDVDPILNMISVERTA